MTLIPPHAALLTAVVALSPLALGSPAHAKGEIATITATCTAGATGAGLLGSQGSGTWIAGFQSTKGGRWKVDVALDGNPYLTYTQPTDQGAVDKRWTVTPPKGKHAWRFTGTNLTTGAVCTASVTPV